MAENGDRISIARGAAGIERMQARFHGQAYAPHRHDTYAVGVTLAGIQSFRYRGEQWHCLPGQCHILHPDELHDGGSADGRAFGYRIVYVDPALVQQALQGAPLPFVGQPVLDAGHPALHGAARIWDLEDALDDAARTELVVAVADLLSAAAQRPAATSRLALHGLSRIRDAIATCPAERLGMDTLERLSGLDRWTLARQFRAAFGTSPSRFRIMRQLDLVRLLLRQGTPPARAAAEAGFADQSHMARHFRRAYGLTPGRWAALVA
jgi:AraC-like DNA-binding protein